MSIATEPKNSSRLPRTLLRCALAVAVTSTSCDYGRLASGVFEYTLDVSQVSSTESGSTVTGHLIVSHNAAAVFPIDLSRAHQSISRLGPRTLLEIQTKSTCATVTAAPPAAAFPSDADVWTKDRANVETVSVQMPYRASQDTFVRIPSAVCVGVFNRNRGWIWSAAFVRHDDGRAWAQAAFNLHSDVEKIAILFDTTTVVETIRFAASKTTDGR